MNSLGLAPAAIERVSADLVIVPFFADERPLQGAAGRIDWRLCGRLSHLCAAERVRGEPGAAVLIPGGGGVRAPRVLGLGIGVRGDLDAERWSGWTEDALARAAGLRSARIVLALPESGDAHAERLAALAKAVAAAPSECEVWLAPEPSDAAAVSEWLRTAARRGRHENLQIHPPGEGRSPHGASSASSHRESSQASAGRFTR
jgi:hypothetical protein